MPKYKNIAGQRFGNLIAISYAGSGGRAKHARWACVCDCGKSIEAAGAYLRRGSITSCGCVQRTTQFKPKRLDVPGASKTRTYLIWAGMIDRCSERATGKSRRLYFDKGIRVCDRWMSYALFLEDMGEVPPNMSIDRIDGNRNYEPSNCRWATSITQANNTQNNRRLSDGRTVSEAARDIGIKANTLEHRLLRGWCESDALNRPVMAYGDKV